MLVFACVILGAGAANAQVLLRDDFDGDALDTEKWFLPAGAGTFFGRTQIRPPSEPPEFTGNAIRLRLDTHNPTALTPGDSFWGSEIVTQETFPRGDGLAFKARARLVAPVPGGLVASLFSYRLDPTAIVRSEIDFEFLSNDIVAKRERVLTNVFDDDPFDSAGDVEHVPVPGLDLTDFNEYEIRWLPDRIEWFVNGVDVREEADTNPEEDMEVRLNFWAPDHHFAAAYDADLVPVATPEQNEAYFYEVDWVEVRALPEPGPVALRWVGLGIVAFLASARSRRGAPGRERSQRRAVGQSAACTAVKTGTRSRAISPYARPSGWAA
jgi:hypothetical protein